MTWVLFLFGKDSGNTAISNCGNCGYSCSSGCSESHPSMIGCNDCSWICIGECSSVLNNEVNYEEIIFIFILISFIIGISSM